MAAVRCADCGFLAVRDSKTGELREADELVREQPPPQTPREPCTNCPLCGARAADLRKESAGGKDWYVIYGVLIKARNCPAFTPWIRGFSPKEHRQMLDSRDLRAWQDEQRERDRRWHEEQKESERRWQEAQKESDRKWQEAQTKSNRRWQLIVAVVGVLLGAVVGAVATYALK